MPWGSMYEDQCMFWDNILALFIIILSFRTIATFLDILEFSSMTCCRVLFFVWLC